jgi:hypothetical protein
MALGKSDATSQKRVAVLIATLLVLIVVGLVGGIIWYNFEKSSALSVVAAKRLLEESGDATLRRVELFYEPVVTIVALGSRVPELSEMSARDKDERLALVLTGLRRYPQLFSLYVGYENGEFDMVTRIGGDERSDARQALGAPDNAVFAHETIRVDSDGTRHAGWSFLDESGAQIVERAAADATYDPRSRQWYRLARADGKVHRSDPYIFASSHEIGITLSRKLDGASAGVFAADLAVRDVSSFLAEKKITPSSVAFLFNDRGEVVAYPDDSKIQRTVKDAQESTLLPTTIASLGEPALSALYETVSKHGGHAMMPLDVDGRAYLSEVVPILRQFGETSYLGIVVPVDEIIGPINRIRSDALVYSVAVLLLVLPLYVTLVFVWLERQLRRGSYSIGDLHDLGADDPR